ncbi:MAG: FAD-linked oxidase C-terminal domain-containing protein [Candidatus Nanopelagicaceae bacterium]|nr:FAD-linked oxidase C-terminal domain-containing protein [Candidatus Nanopelagicaceae bacterium]
MINARVDLDSRQLDDLRAIVGGRISTNESVLDQHGHDESAFTPAKPSAVVMVNSTEEVSRVLAYCNAEKIPVVPFGAGTSLEGHVVPIFGGVSLDLSNMNRILEIRPDDLVARVQAGVTRVALNEKLSSQGIFFSVDPGADATLGGMAATGAAGTTTVRYGSMRENVMALTAVLADGTIIRTGRETRKLSAGYDLTRLLVGSEGTLAVITELSLRLFGTPEKMAAAVVCFSTLHDGVAAASAIIRSGVPIARCEFLDALCIRNLNAYDHLSLTESPTLFFEFHGSLDNVIEDARIVQEIVTEFNGTEFVWTSDDGERRKLWQARHNSHFAAVAANPGKKGVSTDMAVPPSKLAEAVAMVDATLSQQPFPYTILGHVADGNFHSQLMTDVTKPEELAVIRDLVHEMTLKIIEMGGTCTGEHGIGAGKIDLLGAETGVEAVQVMRGIKASMDPIGILNPGKIFRA